MKKTKLLSCLLLAYSSHILANDLTYQYSVPYSGGANITVSNHGSTSVTIKKLLFSINAQMTSNPWGTLWGWQSIMNTSPNPDGIQTDYVIEENPVVTIAPGSSAILTYGVDPTQIGGPLSPYNVAMDPSTVQVVLDGQSTQETLDIQDKCSGDACKDPGNGKHITAYYPDWAYWRTPKFIANQIPFDKINHITYAFSIFDKNGNVSLYDQDSDAVNIPIISEARKQYPYLNASLSFGGWSWASTPPGWLCQIGESPNGPAACFSQMAADAKALSTFVTKAVEAMKEVNFNGIDIDWEYPANASDASNYVNLITQLRQALDKQGQIDGVHYYLTLAVGAGIDKVQIMSNEQWQSIASEVDYIGAMTYDFHGAFDQSSDFMSAMALDAKNDATATDPILSKYNVIDAMNELSSTGIPKQKLLVGIPIYGRMMSIASAGATQGLYQSITGLPQGEWDNQQSGYTGMINYNCIVDASTCGNSFVLPPLQLVSPTSSNLGQYAMTPWGYTSNLFITYDDASSATYKTDWLLAQGFGGAMLWDLSGDFPANDSRSIVNSVFTRINQSTK